MELLKHEQVQGKYLNIKQQEVDVVYDVFTLATQPGLADKAAQKAQDTVKIQGFRQGKVPRSMIEKRIGTHNLYGNMLSPLWDEFCLKNNIVAGFRTELDEIHARIDGAIVFKVITMLFPTIELQLRDQYTVDVTQDVIAKTAQQLQALRNKHTQINPVENRATVWGDIVTIDFKGGVAGQEEPDLCANDVTIELGARQVVIPGFEEAIVDINKNETKNFDLTLPEDFATRLPNHPRAAALAGDTVNFSVTVKNIQTKYIPQDSELPALENLTSYEELYKQLATRVFEELKGNLDDVCSRASNDIISDNEQTMLQAVQPPLIESRLLNFLDKNKQYFDQLDEEKKNEQLKRIVPSLTKSVYQDVVYSCLLATADATSIRPDNKEVEEEADKFATRNFIQSQGRIKQPEEKERLLKNEYFALYRSVQRRKVYLALRNKIDVKLDENNEDFVVSSRLQEPAPQISVTASTESVSAEACQTTEGQVE